MQSTAAHHAIKTGCGGGGGGAAGYTCCDILKFKLTKYHSRCCRQQICLVTLHSYYSTQTVINPLALPVHFSGLPSKLSVHAYATFAFARPTVVTYTQDVALFFSHHTSKFLVQTFVLKAGNNPRCV